MAFKAERGFHESNKETVELKRELKRAVQEIVEEDDYTLESTDHAMQTLSALKNLKLKILKPQQSLSVALPPREFLCPLSGELMKDPVVIASGQSFDRPLIQKWLNDGHQTCPRSEQVLSHMILIPNQLVREIISRWCKEHAVEIASAVKEIDGEIVTNVDRGYLQTLLEKLSSLSLTDQKVAAKEIRQLTKRSPSSRALFAEITDGIPNLLKPLTVDGAGTHPELQEDLITTVLNLSINENNKKLIAECPMVIPLLIESLRSGNIETRRNAAAAIFTLSALDSNKSMIGELGALKPLIELLEYGNPLAMKDAASAIFSLCIILENKTRAVSEGAVRVIMQKISEHVLIDELLATLALLCSHQKAIEEMGELGAVPCLLGILRENTSERNKENCIVILYTVCYSDRTKLREIRNEEDANGTISQLAQSGTSRAKRKAMGILERINRYGNIANTA